MRKTYISPEFTYTNVYGTYNMTEQSSFFGSKMLSIDNSIFVSNNNIIYYQALNNQQVDLQIENTLPPIIYNSSTDKLTNSTLTLNQSQSVFQLANQTSWILNINLNQILSDYIFALIKQSRAFEGVTNNVTSYNDVNVAINEYISNNVLNRYQFSQITMYLTYTALTGQNSLKYNNIWDPTIAIPSNLTQGLQTQTAYDYSTLKVTFNQTQPSSNYSFNYYFNLLFNRI
jgi:hypothetical protein